MRQAKLRALSAASLKEALRVADQAFESVASRCGAKVIQHSWGFYRAPGNKGQYFVWRGTEAEHPVLLPDQHLLVAEVAIIRDVQPLQEDEAVVVNAAGKGYLQEKQDSLHWAEPGAFQFVSGFDEDATTDRCIWLTDIEPILD